MRIYRVHPAELDRRLVIMPQRCLSVDEQQQAQELRRRGWTIDALMVRFDVARRTMYRYLEGELVDVEVGGHVAAFWLRPGRVPEQAEPWQQT